MQNTPFLNRKYGPVVSGVDLDSVCVTVCDIVSGLGDLQWRLKVSSFRFSLANLLTSETRFSSRNSVQLLTLDEFTAGF